MIKKLIVNIHGSNLIPVFYTMMGVLVVSLFFAGCGGKPVHIANSQWPDTPVRADGTDRDWPETAPQFYDRENNMTIRVMNDSQIVYVAVSIGNQALLRQVLRAGIALTLDPAKRYGHWSQHHQQS